VSPAHESFLVAQAGTALGAAASQGFPAALRRHLLDTTGDRRRSKHISAYLWRTD